MRRLAILTGLAAGLACATAASSSVLHVPRLAHVVVVVFENKERSTLLGSGDALHFAAYAKAFVDLTQYYAVTHPSLPNYLALVSGSTHGIRDDCTACGDWKTSIGTLLSRAGRSWGGYAEGYRSSPQFAKRHMPFLYFRGGSAHVHPLSAFDPNRLPAYALVTPNLCNDAHDCSLTTADKFLAGFLPPLLQQPKTAVFVVFDEGTSNEGGGGHVDALVVGTAVRRHVSSSQHASHYTLLRTIEDALGLPHLGASASVAPLTGIWS